MAIKAPPPSADQITDSFKELADSAARLNAVSDEFAKAVAPIETALKRLNLGVSAWHVYYAPKPDEDGDYWERRIGYAKVGGKWGLALANVSGNVSYPDNHVEEWPFNDAPRWMRVEAIDHVPALLQELVKEANSTASELSKKTAVARELAVTITALSKGLDGRR